MTETQPNKEIRCDECIDAHHHLWHYTVAEFGWLTEEMAMLRRDFTARDLEAELQAAKVDRTVAVQARQSLEETEFLLECAHAANNIAGVVGWVPLTDANVNQTLEHFCERPLFRGVREIAQGQPAGFLERPEFDRGLRELTRLELTYDILIYADQLAEATRLVDRHPNQRFVLDHAAKPFIARDELTPWRHDLQELARRPNITCKLSGLITEAKWKSWTLDTLRPYLDTCVDVFGPQRLLAGSDWPVCLVASGYGRWWETLRSYFAGFRQAEYNAVFGGNAVRAYRLPPEARGRSLSGASATTESDTRSQWCGSW